SFGWVVLLEKGDPAYRARFAHFRTLAHGDGSERWRGALAVDHTIVEMVQGRFEEAEAHLAAAMELAVEDPLRANSLRHVQWELRVALGDAPQAEGGTPVFGLWQADLLAAITALRRGEAERARDLYARIDPGPDLYGACESLRLRFEAELAVALGDADTIARLRERLGPHEGEWLVAMWGLSVNGPVAHWLGLLAAAAGDTSELQSREKLVCRLPLER